MGAAGVWSAAAGLTVTVANLSFQDQTNSTRLARREAGWWRSVEGIIVVTFSLALLLLAAIGLLSIKNEIGMMKMVSWVDHTHEIMEMMKELELDVREAESALHTYILTGDPAQRAEYQKQAFAEMDFHLRELRRLVDSPAQRNILDRIEPLLRLRVALMEDSRKLYETEPARGDQQAALNRSGLALTNRVLMVFGEFIAHESQRLNQDTVERTRDARWVVIAITLSGALGVACSSGALFLVLSGLRRRRQVEQQLVASLSEKEILLKEVHHRVKNNLQVVSSLLSLQSHKLQDPAAVMVFKECRDRIHSMARLHQRLYSRGQFAWIEFEEHLREMAAMLARSHSPPGCEVTLVLETEPLPVDLDLAVTLGLIVNEVIINSLKHAFSGRSAGTLVVELRAGPSPHLIVRDDGVGLPASFDPAANAGLGLELVLGLSRQIQGSVKIENQPAGGTCTTLSFTAAVPSPNPLPTASP